MSTTPFGQDKFIRVNDMQLHYVEWGNPEQPAMLLLHGFQSNAHTWDTYSRAMAATHHVLALDQRGHGDTAWAPGGEYASEAFVSDIVGFLEALRLTPAHLVGHSMGGRHVAMVAADYPHVVRKIVIVDTPAELPQTLLAMRHQQTETNAVSEPETFETFEEVIANGLAQYPLTPESELRHANYHNLSRGSDGKWHWRWDPALLAWRRLNRRRQVDLYAYLRRVQCPTLLVRGQSSPLLTSEVAQKMVEVLPDARVVEVAHAAHTVNADNAEAFNRVAAAFIQE
ncbi:2-(acetamidomethylene)succinate hydrolase [Candidatus Entotheonellaceae bacterium PAL068K]